jgi:hypothetical protein
VGERERGVEGGRQGDAGALRRWEELEARGTRDGIVCLAPPLGVPLYNGSGCTLPLPQGYQGRPRPGLGQPPKTQTLAS